MGHVPGKLSSLGTPGPAGALQTPGHCDQCLQVQAARGWFLGHIDLKLKGRVSLGPNACHLPCRLASDFHLTHAGAYVSGWSLINDLFNFLAVKQRVFLRGSARSLSVTPCS